MMAADTQVSDTLKKFAVKVTTASIKERKEIYGDLRRCLKEKELPEAAVKGLCKLFCLTPHRYRDAASRRELLSVIGQLADSHSDVLVSSLLQGLLNCGVISKNGEPSKSSGSAAFIGLSWTCLLIPKVFSAPEKREGPIWKKMVEVQSLLVAEVVGGAKTTAKKSSLKNLCHLWEEKPGLVDHYISTLLTLEQSPTMLPMLGVCLDFCAAQKDKATIEKHKSTILDLYIKSVLMSKTRPQQHILDQSGSLLRHVTHSAFKELLLPALQKTMLRSPENAMQTVSCLLSAVTLDLSQYAMDIGKAVASQLKANNAQLMEEAVKAMQNLVQQCSDAAAVQDIVSHLFKILGGSEGKLTVVAQKMSVLSGIGSCSHHAVSGTSSQTLSSAVSVMFIPYLQQEVHEGTLVHAVGVLSQWSSRLTVEVPAALLDWLKKAFTLKTSTSAVRHAYLQTMLGAFKGDTLAQASDLIPLLLQTVEKAAAQNSQHALLAEGVAASVLLSRLSLLETQTEAKFSSFWNLILDEKKPLFTTEKFLSQGSEETLLTVLQLCERLFLDHAHRLNTSRSQMYHQAAVAVLLSRSWRVRKKARQTVRKLLSSLGGSSLAHGLLGELRVVINKHKVLAQDVLLSESGELTELGRSYIPPRVLLDALCVVCSAASQWGDPAEAENVAMETLIVTHHPSIVGVRPGLWPLLLSSMKIRAEELIEKNLEAILPQLLEVNADSQAVKNAVGALSVLSPNKLLPRVMSHVIEGLRQPALLQVTREEYAIMQTPDGELHDNSIIQRVSPPTFITKFHPRLNVFLLCLSQVLASQCLTALCASAGGGDGCTVAEQPEIDVLLSALLSSCFSVRDAALRGLLEMEFALSTDSTESSGMSLLRRLWVARFDVEEEGRALAERLWESLGLELVPELCTLLIGDITHHEEAIRSAAAEALSSAVSQYRDQSAAVLGQLTELYHQKLYRPPPVLDALGRVISESPPDQWEARCGIALALNKLSQYLDESQVTPLFLFFVPDALNDRHAEVRRCMLDAALSALNTHGKDNVSSLLPVFEEFLKNAPQDASYDSVRQSVVILMGSLAKHLDKNDPKVKPIVAKLITALSTPSQQVQESVAGCLPPLVPAIKEDAAGIVRNLLQLLLESDKYAERKGAAYGLAGLVKGLGILALKQQDIMTTLTDAIQDKKNFRRREGALFAFEMLCNMLGKLFEPYVVHVLPHLLLCFGDGNQYVREAADDCAKAVMRNLSAHGVKLVLPSLLVALEEESWRTKAGSVELLGAMAFCAPKQLSSCLPSIVPKLTEVLTDSHVKVQKAGQQALRQIGSVIRNPEILAITPILLDALTDPSRRTQTCLQTLLDTKFVHFIDAPSLALIMPIVQRAFQDRSTDTRKMAAQIIGNMYSLTDQKDLSPYLPSVIPGLKASLLDPVPEVRTVSAKALGAMVKGMGESCFDDLLPWLMETLASEQSSVDRSGAAQGLAEVMAGLGVEKLDKLMPDVVQTASKVDIASHVRDGYIMMFIYLPLTFGDKFTPYVGPIIPCILKALADENEYVRDTALRAGQRIISMYAETAIALLLPELEQGLFDDLWRIRFSSVQLLGDLLFHISGVTGKMTTETASEDDNFGTAASNKAIISALGAERRNRVLSGLYMGRSDTQLVVRQASLHVWKIVVSNTPRTLREILPTLFSLLLGFLASTCPDKRTIAARTLGDLVRKLGEKILPEIIPILEDGLRSDKSDERQGVCIGLSEIMKSTSKDAVLIFSESLVPTVRKALCDPLEEVREAAAKTFEQLHATIGHQALDDILPTLLKQLADEDTAEFALDGLKQVMAVKSRSVLPYLVPKLTAPPVNTRVLAFLSAVAGDALTRHLGVILPALLSSLKGKLGTEEEAQELCSCQTVILSVEDEAGQRIIIEDLLEATRGADPGLRQAAITVLNAYFARTRLDYSAHIRTLLSGLIRLLNDSNAEVLSQSWDTINSITKKLDASSQLALIDDLHRDIRAVAADVKGQHLPGFCLPKKGVTCILSVLREGVLTGSPEQKEEAAKALGGVIRLTSPEALRPSVVNITGPLIRILGDRFAWTVKTALLETLTLLLAKVGIALKPFLPQLQTTFLKALQDSSRAVRLRAAEALGQLVSIHTKVDPLFTEQLSAIRNAEDSGVRETMLQALRFVIQGAGAKVDPTIRKNITSTLLGMLGHDEDATRMASAGCIGELCAFLSEEELKTVLLQHVLADVSGVDWMVRHGRSLALAIAVKAAPDRLCGKDYGETVTETILTNATADRIPIATSGIRALGYLMRHHLRTEGGSSGVSQRAVPHFVKCLQNQSSDIRLVSERVLWWVFKDPTTPTMEAGLIKPLLKSLLDNTKDKNTTVRAQSEHTIVSLLRLRQGEETMQSITAILDSASNDLLSECHRRSLKKIASQPDSNEEIDDTILT
ncbi:PREDICTED: translational activator GCN1 [Cyprinodon variegatus]|uniref:translational activator GCN1 n=1 Tax=Cyprinodon variegatus TaxID=28743 RepID=UPI000742AE79|nr:PREDICTED: translational activator GCN1 [Cyprinodon variegatus]